MARTLAIFVAMTISVGAHGERAKVDRSVEFVDLTGKKHTPLAVPGAKAAVFFFLLTDCPNSNAYAPEIQRICDAYRSRGVAAFIVHADPDVTKESAAKHAKDYQLTAPILLDPTHKLVAATGATTAPEAAVYSQDGKTLYLGRIDDMIPDFGKRRPEPTQRDLRDALDSILAGKAVKKPTIKAIGCPLPEPKK